MDIKDENIIEITTELSSEFEVAKELRKYPKDTVIIKNVKGYDLPIISGICNTREKIAKSTDPPECDWIPANGTYQFFILDN